MPGQSGKFVIGDTGETIIYAEWKPSPEAVSKALVRMANKTEDWTGPLKESKEIVLYWIRSMFRNERDPDNVPWKELSEDYREEKLSAGYPDKIMYREGDTYNAATDPENWHVTERDIIFDPSNLPSYAWTHQVGLPERKPPLPQRSFIGIAEDAADDIQATFILWINRIVDDFYDEPIWIPTVGERVTTTSGFSGVLTTAVAFGGGFMVRGAGGRFVGVYKGLTGFN